MVTTPRPTFSQTFHQIHSACGARVSTCEQSIGYACKDSDETRNQECQDCVISRNTDEFSNQCKDNRSNCHTNAVLY